MVATRLELIGMLTPMLSARRSGLPYITDLLQYCWQIAHQNIKAV